MLTCVIFLDKKTYISKNNFELCSLLDYAINWFTCKTSTWPGIDLVRFMIKVNVTPLNIYLHLHWKISFGLLILRVHELERHINYLRASLRVEMYKILNFLANKMGPTFLLFCVVLFVQNNIHPKKWSPEIWRLTYHTTIRLVDL